MAAFMLTGSEPTTLVISVFAFFSFECGAMSMIRISKNKEENEKLVEELMAKLKAEISEELSKQGEFKDETNTKICN
jgi:hypothetical protein